MADANYPNAAEWLTKAYLFKGMRLYSQENYSEAVKYWKRALNVDPDNPKVKRYLEKIREEVGDVAGLSNG